MTSLQTVYSNRTMNLLVQQLQHSSHALTPLHQDIDKSPDKCSWLGDVLHLSEHSTHLAASEWEMNDLHSLNPFACLRYIFLFSSKGINHQNQCISSCHVSFFITGAGFSILRFIFFPTWWYMYRDIYITLQMCWGWWACGGYDLLAQATQAAGVSGLVGERRAYEILICKMREWCVLICIDHNLCQYWR